MAKLTREQRIEIYTKRKQGLSIKDLSKEYRIRSDHIIYLILLIDRHGLDILRTNKNNHYPTDLKLEIINHVLVKGNSVRSTAIEFGLSNNGMLFNWIKSYKENGYVIVEKSRGRLPMTKNRSNKKYEDMTSEEKLKFLEEKNLYLEAENAYLKKLRAVVQDRKMREQKKK